MALLDWYPLGDVQYRKWEIYNMQWNGGGQGAAEEDAETGAGEERKDARQQRHRRLIVHGADDALLPLGDEEDMALDGYIVCGAMYGGPLALYRAAGGASSASSSSSSSSSRASLRIYSAAGELYADVEWDSASSASATAAAATGGGAGGSSSSGSGGGGGRLVGMEWTDQELLCVCLESGNVLLYDLQGLPVKTFLLFQDEDGGAGKSIEEVCFWGNGLVARMSSGELCVVEGLGNVDVRAEPRRYVLYPGLTSERQCTAMAVIPPALSRSGLLEVILATRDNSVVVVDENGAEDQLLQERILSHISKMTVAPNGRFLACFTASGTLTVMSTTFTTKVLDFDTKSSGRPLQIVWCGEDSVVLYWRNMGLIMVGPYGDWMTFPYDDALRLIPEPDCCRIVTSQTCEMLQRVPASTEAIRRIGSTDPAALLYDAMEAFEEGDPKADENIRSIENSNQLMDAVQACIAAAAAEFDVDRQMSLLKAASYGKAFCAQMDADEFVKVCKKLRVLNSVRSPEVGLPLTSQQYNRLTPQMLVHRLIKRHHHFLALRICTYLKLRKDVVLIHWACEKLKAIARDRDGPAARLSDEQVCDMIKERLTPYGRISYLDIANTADQVGRRRLATMLLDMEPHAADQVPLLLSMNEEELALQKAINSSDTDLIYLALIHLEKSSSNDKDFFRLVYAHPEAANLLKVYYRHKMTAQDRSALQRMLSWAKQYQEAATACIMQAYMQPTYEDRQQKMREGGAIFGASRDLQFHQKMTEEQCELLEVQRRLEVRTHRPFLDLSLSETLYNLILLSLENPTDANRTNQDITNLCRKFRVSEKHLYHLKIRAFSSMNRWGQLRQLATERRSPVGYAPFARAAIDGNQSKADIESYVDRITPLEDRFELYMEVQSYGKAAEVAAKTKDQMRLHEVLRTCQDPTLQRQIQEMMSRR